MPARSSAVLANRPQRFWDRVAVLGTQEQSGTPPLLRTYEDMRLGWFWATDAEGDLTYLSDWIEEQMTAGSGAPVLGRTLLSVFSAETREDTESTRTLPFLLAKHAPFENMLVRSDGPEGVRWWSLSGRPSLNAAGEFTGYHGHGSDVTRQRMEAEENARLASHDSLTDLPNRRQVSARLETLLNKARLHGGDCTFMLIDLDRFKQVNDTMGHQAGDILLQQVAERLVNILGDREKVGRLGGDEFVVLLPDFSNETKLQALAQTIIEQLSQPYSVNGARCIIGASVGVAIGPGNGANCDELIRNADLALYSAKAAGRGRYRFFSRELLEAAEERRTLEHDLLDALARDEMAVHYQPIVNAVTNEVTGFEALLRWNHPQRGAISPAIFVPIAEEADLIVRLGEWTLRRACEDAAAWPADLRVAVNVSAVQFALPNLPSVVLSALASSGLDPHRLELEITESVFLGDSGESDAMFETLKSIGVRLALDDFGTGYSSLGYLKTAPFDKIKIDQSFVRGATRNGTRNQAIISAIVALATALDMETTAEGVESFDQLEMVRSLHVSHVQGFIYSKAVPQQQLLERLEQGEWVIAPAGPAFQRSLRHATFRRIGAIHHNHYYPVILRNLSSSGALIEGLVDVPEGTQFVLDFGDGQLVVASVRRSMGNQQGVEFEEELVHDSAGGLYTRTRVSPQALAALGIRLDAFNNNDQVTIFPVEGQLSIPAFRTLT
ncbi:putative bifunctional diguanylate cyclase/phosphodiesterase [Sphingomonas canadensis]|uniref:Bifunctional diguanylate cyclase/phosphodiesterase n=1 Tax=Sphingomonas canadensis TaxID=1219257 RepID=A0ABW3H6G2_9SPHN|nr:EAL domain-containing protein [Sphingomonas canadensis]MCW3835790.1 EAL domain-containing protein [Sphingomonas canadensis]